MNISPTNLDTSTVLKTCLAKRCEGMGDFVATFEKRMDFVALLKKVISESEEVMEISHAAYERLQLAIQKDSSLLMASIPHLKFLVSYLIKYPAAVTENKKEFRDLFCEMVKKGEPKFGMIYIHKGHPSGHVVAVYFERKNEHIHAFISDGEARFYNTSEIVYELEKAVKDEKMKETLSCYSLSGSERRQNDGFSCSMFALKDLSVFSNFSLTELLEKNEEPLPVETDFVCGVKENGVAAKVNYYLLDSLIDQFPSSYFKASQTERTPPRMKVKVEVKRPVITLHCYEEMNYYTRYFNLKCLAKAVDEGAL